MIFQFVNPVCNASPSSRRAWIEIYGLQRLHMRLDVALLAEGVDRNIFCGWGGNWGGKSPSSRRAWIEIYATRSTIRLLFVALLAEGVDRNSAHAGPRP